MTHDYLANLRNDTARKLFCHALEHFVIRIVADGIHRAPLTAASIAAVREECILGLKKAHASSISIDEEAAIIAQAIDDLEKRLDAIIANGWEDTPQ
jgi:hypothetical protein